MMGMQQMVKGGEERALWLSLHVLPHEESIKRIIGRWRLPHGLEAEDILQEAYANMARMQSVAHVSSPRAYFMQIARSVLLMHVRRARLVSIEAFAGLEDLPIRDDEPSPEQQVSDRQQLRMLAEAVTLMKEPNRSVFLFSTLHNLPHKAIGKKLGLSENAVQKMLARTLNRLGEKLGRGGNDGVRASDDLNRTELSKADNDDR